MHSIKDDRRPALLAAALSVLALALLMLTLGAGQASAQSPAICEQYPDLPQCLEEIDEGEDPPGGPIGEQAGGTGDPQASGSLPFTGYPLSALILLLLILLLTGLTIRAYLAIRDRVTNGSGPRGLS